MTCLVEDIRNGCDVFGRGKLLGFTQTCEINDSRSGEVGKVQDGEERSLAGLRGLWVGASQGKGALRVRRSWACQQVFVTRRRFFVDGLSLGAASWRTGYISYTTDRRCPPAWGRRGRPRIAKTCPAVEVRRDLPVYVHDVGCWLFPHRTRSSRLHRSPPLCGDPLLGLPESYWASRDEAATGGIAGVEGKRTRPPLAVL